MSNLAKLLLKPSKNERELGDMLRLLGEVPFFRDLNLVDDFSEEFLLEFLTSIKGVYCQEG
jgi:hypothetical protein